MRRSHTTLLFCALVLAAGAGGYALLQANRLETPLAPVEEPGPIPVEARLLATREARIAVDAWGTVEAEAARLATEVGGPVVRVSDRWRDGASVPAGEELFAIDPELLELEVERATGLLREAQALLEAAADERDSAAGSAELSRQREELARADEARVEVLFERGDLPRSALDGARTASTTAELEREAATARTRAAGTAYAAMSARLDAANSAVALARERLERAVVRAPFAGRIEGARPRPGTVIAPLEPLGRLLSEEDLRLVCHVPAREANDLFVGARARVELPAQRGRSLTATVSAIAAGADPRTRTVRVELDFDPRDGEHEGVQLIGRFARASIELETRTDTLVVARGEYVIRGGVPTAFVLEPLADPRATEGDGATHVARARALRLGPALEGGGAFVVEHGLLAGERLAPSRLEALRDGEPCRAVESAGAGRVGAGSASR